MKRWKSHNTFALISSEPEAAFVAEAATRSLLYEVSVSPKPGLVDRFDSGAHSDMDFFTYIDSSAALTEYFRSAFLLGRSINNHPPKKVFAQLKELGIQAEHHMYAATNGINTHKGIIFTLGLFCGSLGYLVSNEPAFDAHRLLQVCSQMAAPAMAAELEEMQQAPAVTGGERLYAAVGKAGIRSEAAAGYPSIREHGLPALRQALARGYSINDAGILVLLELLCCVQDSNIFARCGAEKQSELIRCAQKILAEEFLDLKQVEEFNLLCIRDHVSPGGCADLLAATFFLHFCFD